MKYSRGWGVLWCLCHWKRSVPEVLCFQMCPSVSRSVHPENRVSTTSRKPMKGVSSSFRRRYMWVRWCAGWMLESKGQISRSQQAMIRQQGVYNIFIVVGTNFAKIRSHVRRPGDILIRFYGQKVKGHSRQRLNCQQQLIEFRQLNSVYAHLHALCWKQGPANRFFFSFESNLESNRPSDSISNRIFESNRPYIPCTLQRIFNPFHRYLFCICHEREWCTQLSTCYSFQFSPCLLYTSDAADE